jgi:hypothetical protein
LPLASFSRAACAAWIYSVESKRTVSFDWTHQTCLRAGREGLVKIRLFLEAGNLVLMFIFNHKPYSIIEGLLCLRVAMWMDGRC